MEEVRETFRDGSSAQYQRRRRLRRRSLLRDRFVTDRRVGGRQDHLERVELRPVARLYQRHRGGGEVCRGEERRQLHDQEPSRRGDIDGEGEPGRSAERRVGKGGGSTGRSWWSAEHLK